MLPPSNSTIIGDRAEIPSAAGTYTDVNSIVEALTFFVLYFFARRENIVSFDISGTLKIWLASAVMSIIVAGLMYYLGENFVLLPAYVLIGLSIYLALARTLKLFREENRELVLSLFPDRFVRLKMAVSLLILH